MKISFSRTILYSILILFAIFYIVPVFVVVNTSFKTFEEVNKTSIWTLASGFNLSAYTEAFDKLKVGFLNSLILTIPAVIISSCIGSFNGYLLSKWKFRGSELIFTMILFGMFIPYQSILIPLVQFLKSIGLYGSIFGLILVHVIYGLPISTLIFRNYYSSVPTSLVEAARIDGSNLISTYRYVIFPISIPAFVVVMIWQFTSIWNEFLFAVTITSNPSQQPITVALQGLSGSLLSQWQLQMAGALLTAIPTLVVYLLLSRYFVQGLLAGSVKG